VDDETAALEARVAELERRMDQVLSRIGYQPGELPLQRDDAQWHVSPEVVERARSGTDKDLAAAILQHIKETGADPNTAEQAVRSAAGR
jgi:hypothetical protein